MKIAVRQDQEALTVYNIDNVRGHLTLPVKGDNGTTITWQSGSPEVIAASGEVTRPSHGSGNAIGDANGNHHPGMV